MPERQRCRRRNDGKSEMLRSPAAAGQQHEAACPCQPRSACGEVSTRRRAPAAHCVVRPAFEDFPIGDRCFRWCPWNGSQRCAGYVQARRKKPSVSFACALLK
jgi:hypothetical protein